MNKHSTYNFDGKQVMGFPRAPYGDVSRDPASAVDIDRPGARYGTWDAGVLEVLSSRSMIWESGHRHRIPMPSDRTRPLNLRPQSLHVIFVLAFYFDSPTSYNSPQPPSKS